MADDCVVCLAILLVASGVLNCKPHPICKLKIQFQLEANWMLNQYICTLSRQGTPIQVWPDTAAVVQCLYWHCSLKDSVEWLVRLEYLLNPQRCVDLLPHLKVIKINIGLHLQLDSDYVMWHLSSIIFMRPIEIPQKIALVFIPSGCVIL